MRLIFLVAITSISCTHMEIKQKNLDTKMFVGKKCSQINVVVKQASRKAKNSQEKETDVLKPATTQKVTKFKQTDIIPKVKDVVKKPQEPEMAKKTRKLESKQFQKSTVIEQAKKIGNKKSKITQKTKKTENTFGKKELPDTKSKVQKLSRAKSSSKRQGELKKIASPQNSKMLKGIEDFQVEERQKPSAIRQIAMQKTIPSSSDKQNVWDKRLGKYFYDIYLAGNKGKLEIKVSKQDGKYIIESRIRVEIQKFWITWYYFENYTKEVWENFELQSVFSKSDSNGHTFHFSFSKQGKHFVEARNWKIPAAMMTETQWNLLDIAKERKDIQVFRISNGRTESWELETQEDQKSTVMGREIDSKYLRFKSSQREIWLDELGNIVRQRDMIQGYRVEYFLVGIDTSN